MEEEEATTKDTIKGDMTNRDIRIITKELDTTKVTIKVMIKVPNRTVKAKVIKEDMTKDTTTVPAKYRSFFFHRILTLKGQSFGGFVFQPGVFSPPTDKNQSATNWQPVFSNPEESPEKIMVQYYIILFFFLVNLNMLVSC
jgi:hypothetical protein